MPRKLRVKRWPVQVFPDPNGGFFRLRIETSDPEDSGMDPAVFVFRVHPPDPRTGETPVSFVTVASPVDMEDYPTEAPSRDLSNPFFRTNTVELDFRSVAELNETWHEILRLLDGLLHGLDRLESFNSIGLADLFDTP